MLEAIKKNKMKVVMVILFGVFGVLIIPMILGIQKFSKKFPKAYNCILLTIFGIIMVACVYCFFSKHQTNFLVICICTVVAICNIMKKEDK